MAKLSPKKVVQNARRRAEATSKGKTLADLRRERKSDRKFVAYVKANRRAHNRRLEVLEIAHRKAVLEAILNGEPEPALGACERPRAVHCAFSEMTLTISYAD